jgi:creatine kinase
MSVKLVRLGREEPELFQEILHRLHLEAKSDYAETDQRYTGIFDIANAERLGRTEVQLINIMILGIAKLIELEKKLERGEKVTLDDVKDVVDDVKANSSK